MSSPSQLHHWSYPVDHHDPAIQHQVQGQERIHQLLDSFGSNPITAKNLRALGDALAPNNKSIKAANAVIRTVQQAVSMCRGVSVARFCVGGSFGKSTALSTFDIDLILFLNEAKPPFESELELLQSHISKQLTGVEMIKSSRFSITFLLEGFKVDLLPAPNLVPGESPNPQEEQRAQLLQELASTPKRDLAERARFLSPAFAESIVQYMKQQSAFVNAAVRLAKLWRKSCVTSSYSFPKWFTSYLVELIASDAANTELQNHASDASLVRVLHSFIKKLSKPQELNLVLSTKDVPNWIATQRPLVVDPVNPYLNVASHVGWEVIRLLALETLEVLNKLMNLDASSGMMTNDLFLPRLGIDLPRLYRQCNFQLRFIGQHSWLRSLEVRRIVDLAGKKMEPGVNWRAMGKLERSEEHRVSKPHILRMLDTLVHVSTMAMLFYVQQLAQKSGVSEVVSTSNFADEVLLEVFNQPKISWTPCNRTHESCDASLLFGQVPVASAPDDLRYIYFKLSFDVDDRALDFVCHSIASDVRRHREEAEEASEEYPY